MLGKLTLLACLALFVVFFVALAWGDDIREGLDYEP